MRRVAVAAALGVGVGMVAAPASAAVEVVPLGAALDDHVGVAVALSALAFDVAEHVLVGRSDDFPDSLASGSMQASAPLLLTPPGFVHDAVTGELDRLAPARATILGGVEAVGPEVEAALEARGLAVDRLAGATRVETAVAVARAVAPADAVIVARAYAADEPTQAFADSLGAGAWAAATRMPVLLTQTEQLSSSTAEHLADAGVRRAFVVGGTAAVGTEVDEALRDLGIAVERVAGAERAATAVAVAAARGMPTAASTDTVVLVDGASPHGWAAGFAAAGLAARRDAAIVLADGSRVPDATAEWLAGATFAQQAATTLVCAADGAACAAAAELLGAAAVTLAQDGGVVHHGTPLQGTAVPGVAQVTLAGGCLPGGDVTVHPDADGAFTLAIAAGPDGPDAGTCELGWTAVRDDGRRATGTVEVVVEVADVRVRQPRGFVPLGAELRGTVDVPADEVTLTGPCIADADGAVTVPVAADGSFAAPPVHDAAALGTCTIAFAVAFDDGGAQMGDVVADVGCLGGYVADHDGGGSYALYDGDPDELHRRSFTTSDAFEIAGEQVSYATFADVLEVGACVTPFRAELDPTGTPHRLWPVDGCRDLPGYDDPQRVFAIDHAADTYVTEEAGTPVTVTYRRTDEYWIDGDEEASYAAFEAELIAGVCIDYVPARAGGTPVHRLQTVEIMPLGSYRV